MRCDWGLLPELSRGVRIKNGRNIGVKEGGNDIAEENAGIRSHCNFSLKSLNPAPCNV